MRCKNILHFLRYSIIVFALAGAQNQCSNTVYTTLGDLAKRNPNFTVDAVPLCDRYLTQDWYSAEFYQIPTTAPSLLMCGTTYPYWMDDTAPANTGQTKSVKMCRVGFTGNCESSHNIQMTNCGGFFVYELIPLDICSSAYCFKQSDSCVSDVPSNIEVRYHAVSWTTSRLDARTVHDPDVNLACYFDRLRDQSLYYDVTWYVDNTEVLTKQTVTSSSSDIPLLSGTQMLAKGKKANSMIHCVVGAKLREEDRACNTLSSSLFFAGIRILTPILRIPRGGNKEVQFQFTFPFINQHSILQLRDGRLEEQFPLYINMGVHGATIECDNPNRKLCDVEVNAYNRSEAEKYATNEWKVIHKIKVYNKDDGDFTLIDKHLTLRFETGTTSGIGSKIFEGLKLPDVQVFIEDTNPSWKGAICQSHTDPHMRTFDGKYYECQLDGTFVLYRNEHFQQEVQEKHHLCHQSRSYPRCSCAVAVRSGKDVFIVDICNYRTIINFPSCEDKVLKVIKVKDKYYKVILPTGTLVEIKFVSWPYQDDWQLNVDIFPSPSDVGNSSGLCGILDGDYRNDFTRNDAAKTVDNPDVISYSNPPNAFSESWRIGVNDIDLFDHNEYANLNSISTVLDRVCTCEKKNPSDRSGDIVCNYGTYKNCKFLVGKQFHCILNPEGQLRRKRDLRHVESLFSDIHGYKSLGKRQKREVAPTVKTYEEAEQICTTAFQNSRSYSTCQEYVSDLSNTSLVNCILDVMMTGDDNFTKIHIEAALEQCYVFVVLNTTFQQTEPDVTYKIESFCQNNCSGHGVCDGGNCTCESNFAGSDCSFDLLGPPSITHISDFGLCDKSKEPCDEITLYGKYFIEQMNTNCYMKRNTLREDGTTASTIDYKTSLQERTLFEGYCPLEYSIEDHWVTAFAFNISNDGTRYTDNYNVYTYQSLCQEYQNNTGNITFLFKDGYCYINNTCFADGAPSKENTCDICDTSISKHKWSFNPDHCFIDGVCYKSGDINGTNPCSVCIPTINTTIWSPAQDLCFIDGVCYLDGQTKPNSNCNVCNSNVSKNAWTFKNGFCLIMEQCFIDGQSNASNPCEICDITQSNSSWKINPGCISTTASEQVTSSETTSTARTTTVQIPSTEKTITTTTEPTTYKEPTTTTTDQTTVLTTTTIEDTTTIPEPKTTTPEPTTSTTEPTTTTTKPTTTTTTERTTTTTEPTTTTIETTTTTPEPTTTTPEPTTTTPEPTTTTPEPTTTTTPKPTTTTTTEPTTTTPEPNPTTPEPTTTSEPTTSSPKPTTTTREQTTTTAEPAKTSTEPKTTTSSCLKSPEGVTVVYHNVSWISTKETESRTIHEPLITLRCNFTLLTDAFIYYKIEWYVDTNTLIKTQTVAAMNIEHSFLHVQDLVSWNKTAGTKITCKVGVTRSETKEPCSTTTSPMFVAGIEIDSTDYKVPRKGKTKIGFQLKVPYVAKTVEVDGEMETLSPLEVHTILPPVTPGCKDSLGVDRCVIYISAYLYNESQEYESGMWREPHAITVYHIDTDGYEIDFSQQKMQLKTMTGGDSFWNGVSYGDITIDIEEDNNIWKGKFCGSKTDPHMYSFDGISYENHIPGEFILYRNTMFNQEVQTKHRLCHSDYSFPHCTCAVSVQSGQDVFLIDVCAEREVIDFVSCNDSSLKVYQLHDKLYKVLLPTGTYVKVSLVEWPIRGAWQLDIDIYPSVSDVNNTEGLCGTLDGNKENEFTRRNGSKESVTMLYPNSFSESWKVESAENLLNNPIVGRPSIASTLDHICSCTPTKNQCSYNTLTTCSNGHEKQFLCTKQLDEVELSRTKRDITDQNINFATETRRSRILLRERRQTIQIVKTRDEAELICKSAFENFEPYQICEDNVSDLSNSSYSNCINDLIMTGDENLTSIHVESALQRCVTFVGMNSTLQKSNPVVTTSLHSLCPSNCSNHGVCNNGNCTCDKAFGGSDCSFDALSPPVIWNTFPVNTCDKSTQTCSRIDFKGRYFLENIEKTCFINTILVENDGSMLSTTLTIQPLEEDNLFQGSCSLPYVHTATWVTKFTVNVSYDGQQFTEAFSLYVYQSECQQQSGVSGQQFSLKDGFCFINNTCVKQGFPNTQNNCELCEPGNNKYDWTMRQSCVSTSNPTTMDSTVSSLVFIVIASVLSCVFVVAAVIIFCIWKCQHTSKQKKEFYVRESLDDFRGNVTGKLWTKYFDSSSTS